MRRAASSLSSLPLALPLLLLLSLPAFQLEIPSVAVTECGTISSPGLYELYGHLEGAPVDGSPWNGTACLKITSPDVTLDCKGYGINNNGTGGETAGILIIGAENVTIAGCGVIGNYTYAEYRYALDIVTPETAPANESAIANETIPASEPAPPENESTAINETTPVPPEPIAQGGKAGGGLPILGGDSGEPSIQDACTCNSCSDCETKLNSTGCGPVQLTVDINGQATTCINDPINFENKTFDCQGHFINGTLQIGAYGVYLEYQTNASIANCRIWNMDYGVYLSRSNGTTIRGVDTYNDAHGGFELYFGRNTTILDSTARDVTSARCFSLYYDDAARIQNSTAYNCEYGFHLTAASNATLHNNTAFNNTGEMYSSGFYVWLSPENTFTSNRAHNNSYAGFYVVENSSLSSFRNNAIFNNSYGIDVTASGLNNFTNNTLENHYLGINLYSGTANNLVINNTARGHSNYGFFLYGSRNNTVSGNVAYNNSESFRDGSFSQDNLYEGNIAANNSRAGFTIESGFTNLTGNNVSGSRYGISLDYASNITLRGNMFFRNGLDIVSNSSTGISVPEAILLNPWGTLANYTNLSIAGQGGTGSYSINWSASPASLPPNYISFAQKFVNITNLSANATIAGVTWHWPDSELPGYDESRLELWRYDSGGWSNMNATLNAGANSLNISNLMPASVYGILENGTGGNGTPAVTTITLNSTFGTNYTTENLTVYATVSGGSGPIKNITNWHRNSAPAAILNMPFEQFLSSVEDGFSDSQVNGNRWVSVVDNGAPLQDGSGTLRLNSTFGGAAYSGGAVRSLGRWQLAGDADVQIDFSGFNTTGTPTNGGLLLYLYINASDNARIGRDTVTGSPKWFKQVRVNGAFVANVSASDPTDSGKLRISRTGNAIRTYYDNGTGWVELGTATSGFGTGPVSVFIDLRMNGTGAGVAYVDNFTKNSGTVQPGAKDYSGYGNWGTAYNATWNATGGYDGNGAYMFAANACVQLPKDIISGPSAISVEGRFRSSTSSTYRQIFSIEGYYGMYLNNDAVGKLLPVFDGSSAGDPGFGGGYNDGNWHHFVAMNDGTATSLYVDGVFAGSRAEALADPAGLSRESAIGSHWNCTMNFNGTVDDVRIYLNRALSAQEVLALYRNRTDLMASQELRGGEVWWACVTPNDGTQDGNTSCSNNLTVQALSYQSVTLNSTLGTNITNENLTVYPVLPPVPVPVKNITSWYRNNAPIAALIMPFERSGTQNATDYSGFGNNGAVTGAIWNATGGYDGKGAYRFDGYDDCARIPDSNPLDIQGGITVSIWVYPRGEDAFFDRLVSKPWTSDASPWHIYTIYRYNATQRHGFAVANASSITVSALSTSDLPENEWSMLTGTYNGSRVSVYVNGALNASSAIGGNLATNNMNVTIGCNSWRAPTHGWPEYYNGTIDDVQIYNRSLSAEEIWALYSNRTDRIVSQELRAGEIWKACVTPNDGTQDGNTSCSNNLAVEEYTGPCMLIDAPGTYRLNTSVMGASYESYEANELNHSCIKIAASDVDFDCGGYRIINNGTANAAGILVNGSAGSPYTNVTIRNCPNVSGYKYGTYLHHSDGTSVIAASASGGGIGFYLFNSSNGGIYNSSAYGNSNYGFLTFLSENNTLRNCTAHRNLAGFGLSYGRNNTIRESTAYNNTGYGFELYITNNNTLYRNTAANSSTSGYFLTSAHHNSLANNTAYGCGEEGFYFLTAYNNTVANTTSYRNVRAGTRLYNVDDSIFSTALLYNNGNDTDVLNTGGAPFTINMSSFHFLNPYGTLANYTRMSMDDVVEGSSRYTVSWNRNPGSLPGGSASFAQKFVNITPVYGAVSIEKAVWHWYESEGGAESTFELWKHNGTWSDTGAFLNTGTNTLTLTNLAPGSAYGILQMDCVVPVNDYPATTSVTFCPGTYSIADTGSAGVIIANASGITLTCANTTIVGGGSGTGVMIAGRTGVKLRGCTIRNYANGVYLDAPASSNNLSNNTISGATNGIYFYLDSGDSYYNVFEGNAVYGSANGFWGYNPTTTSANFRYNNFSGNVMENLSTYAVRFFAEAPNWAHLYVENNRWAENNFTNVSQAFYLYLYSAKYFRYNTFHNNTVNRAAYGIYFDGGSCSSGTLFYPNYFVDNAFANISSYAVYIPSGDIPCAARNNFGSANTVNGRPFYHYSQDNLVIENLSLTASNDATNYGLFSVFYGTNVTIRNSNITGDREHGVYLYETSGNTATANRIWNNGNANGESCIYDYSGASDSLRNNSISGCYYGLYLVLTDIDVINNTILDSPTYGIYMTAPFSYNNVSNNTILRSGTSAIFFYLNSGDSEYNIFRGNTMGGAVRGIDAPLVPGGYNEAHLRYNDFLYNVIENVSGYGVHVYGEPPNHGIYYMEYNDFIGNNITNSSRGINIYGTDGKYYRYNQYVNNTINRAAYGVYIDGPGGDLGGSTFTGNRLGNITSYGVYFTGSAWSPYRNNFGGSNTINGYPFYHYYQNNVLVENVSLNRSNDATNLGLFSVVYSSNVTLRNGSVTDDREHGVFFYENSGAAVDDSRIWDNGDAAGEACVYDYSGSGDTIRDSALWACSYGLSMPETSIRVINNSIENNTYGMVLDAPASSNNVTGNRFSGNPTAIYFYLNSGDSNYNTFEGNVITRASVGFYAYTPDSTSANFRYNNLTRNVFENLSDHGFRTYAIAPNWAHQYIEYNRFVANNFTNVSSAYYIYLVSVHYTRYNEFINDTITRSPYGFYLQANGVFNNNNIRGASINATTYPIYSVDTVPSGNQFYDTTLINEQANNFIYNPGATITLNNITFSRGAGRINFPQSGISSTHHVSSSYVVLGSTIASLNTGTLTEFARGGAATLAASSCPTTPYKKTGFPTTANEIFVSGSACNPPECNMTYCNATDGYATFDLASFSGYTLNSNGPPTQGAPILNSTYNLNHTSPPTASWNRENLTIWNQSTYDPDGDNVTNIYNWRVGGQSVAVLNMPFDTYVTTLVADAVRDYSGRGNDGQLGGGTAANAPAWVAGGRNGGAYQYDGSTDYIDIPASATFDVQRLTISAWIYSNAIGSNMHIFEKGDVNTQYSLFLGGANMYFRTLSSGAVLDDLGLPLSAIGVTNGSWHHVAATYDGSAKRIYVNGVLKGQKNYTATLRTGLGTAERIGAYGGATPSYFFNGIIDEVRVYNRSLSGAEIRALYSMRPDILASEELRPGQYWNATVTPNDGWADGTANWTNTVEILNALPTQGAPAINSTRGTNVTDENLTAFNQSTLDADGDAVTNIYDWRRENVSIAVLNMPFDTFIENTSAGAVRDYSTFGNNGTLAGIPTWTADGASGGAFVFDGINDYIGAGHVLDSVFAGADRKFTISAWVRQSSVNMSSIVAKTADTGCSEDQRQIVARIYNDTTPAFLWHTTLTYSAFRQVKGSTPLNQPGRWYHLVFVYDGSVDTNDGLDRVRIYVDGAPENTSMNFGAGPMGDIPDGTAHLGIGKSLTSSGTPCGATGGFFNGTIDEVRIYNRTLSPEQVIVLYNNRPDILVGNETRGGENWSVAITPNDAWGDGETSVSNTVLMRSAPRINSANPLPASPLPYINQSFLITANVTDEDFNLVSVNFTITAPNGTAVVSNQNGTVSGDLWNSSTVDMGLLGTWNWSITATDIEGLTANASGQILMLDVGELLSPNPVDVNASVIASGRINLTDGSDAANAPVYVYFNGTLLPRQSPLDGWLNISWPYRGSFNVTEASGNSLTNYSTRLSINTQVLISLGRMRADCGDLRFSDASGTELGYWLVAGCNTPSTGVWVLLPTLNASATEQFYIYYGNPSAAGTSDPSAALLWYDNFTSNTLSSYSQYGGTWSWNSGGYVSNPAGNPEAALTMAPVTSPNILVSVRGRSNDDDGTGAMARANGVTNYYTCTTDPQNDRCGIGLDSGRDNLLASVAQTQAGSDWITTTLRAYGTSLNCTCENGADIKTITTTHSGLISGRGGALSFANEPVGNIDSILARNYVSPEPSWVLNGGGETLPTVSTNFTGHYAYAFTAPSESGNYTVLANLTYGGMYGEAWQNLTVLQVPGASINGPVNGYNSSNASVAFNCSALDDAGLANITLYSNFSGAWAANETAPIGGVSNSTEFARTLANGTYLWNCLACDGDNMCTWGDANRTLLVDTSDYNLTYLAAPVSTSAYGYQNGSFENASYDPGPRAAKLEPGQYAGAYASRVFDVGLAAVWKNLSWAEGAPYGEMLPNNKSVENMSGGANMSRNLLLYHMGEGSGTTTADSSGSGYTGTIYSATWGSPGKFGNALSFDGINDYVNTTLQINFLNPFTVCTWANTRSLAMTDWQRVLLSNRFLGANNSFDLYLGNGTTPVWGFHVWNYTGSSYYATGTTPAAVGAWQHVCGVYYPNDRMQLFVNGVMERETAGLSGFTGAVSWTVRLGIHNLAEDRYFNGTMDEAAIWNRTLSAQEIADIYNRGAMRLNFSARSCGDPSCAGEPWSPAYGGSPSNLSLAQARYFQYLASLGSDRATVSPELFNVTVAYARNAPALTTPAISPVPAYKTTNLSANTTYTDADNDTGTVYFRWHVNGINTLNQTFYNVTNATTVLSNLSTTYFNKTSYVNVSVHASDFMDISQTLWSSTIAVQNSLPNQTTPLLNSTYGQNRTTENLTVHNRSTYDADNDPVKNIINWQRNGTSITVLNMPFAGGSQNGTASGVANAAKDYSGFTNNATAYNATWNAAGGYDGAGAYEFNGVNRHLAVPHNSSLALATYSIELVFRLNEVAKYQNLISKDRAEIDVEPTYNANYDVRLEPDSRLLFDFENSAGANYELFSQGTLAPGRFYHVVVTMSDSANSASMYIDGALNSSGAPSITPNTQCTQVVRIGRAYSDASGFRFPLNGTISLVRIYNRGLSAEQVRALYSNLSGTIVSNETSVGETWSACITPNDGYGDGSTNCSNNLTIRQGADIHTNDSLMNASPASPAQYANTIVNVSALANDNFTGVNVTLYIDSLPIQSQIMDIPEGNTSVQFIWNATPPGNHSITVWFDPGREQSETDRSDNNATAPILVKYVAAMGLIAPADGANLSRGNHTFTFPHEDGLQKIDENITAVARVYDYYNSSRGLAANCSFGLNGTVLGTNLSDGGSGICAFAFNRTIYSPGMYNITANFSGQDATIEPHETLSAASARFTLIKYSTNLSATNRRAGGTYNVGDAGILNITFWKNDTLYDPPYINVKVKGSGDSCEVEGSPIFEQNYPGGIVRTGTGAYYAKTVFTAAMDVHWCVFISDSEANISTASHSDVTVNAENSTLNATVLNNVTGSGGNSSATLYDAALYELKQANMTAQQNSFAHPTTTESQYSLNISTRNASIRLNRFNFSYAAPQVLAQFANPAAGIRNSSMIIAMNGSAFNFTNATLSFPRGTSDAYRILRCQNWDFAAASCPSWAVDLPDGYAYESNSTHFRITVSSFSAYGGILASSVDIISCQALTTPGNYTLTASLSGAPVPANPPGGSACIVIAAPNVTLDCNSYGITNDGTAGTTYGIIANGSATGFSARNCNVANYTHGFYAHTAGNGSFANIRATNNPGTGITLSSSVNITVYGSRSCSNGAGLNVSNRGATLLPGISVRGAVFDNPACNLSYHTNLSMSDALEPGSEYAINWIADPGGSIQQAFPIDKFVSITNASNSSIDRINWTWSQADLTAYNLDPWRLGVWRLEGGVWSAESQEPDVGSRSIPLSNLSRFGQFGMFQSMYRILRNCTIINTSGLYLLGRDINGSPYDAGPMGGEACIKISAPNVYLNCEGHQIVANESGLTYGVLINQSAANITVAHCSRIENYSYGIYALDTSNSAFYNNTYFNNTYGIYLNRSSNNSIFGSLAYRNSFGFSIHNSTDNNISNNIGRYGIHGFEFIDSRGNYIFNNTADHNRIGFLFLMSEGNVVNASIAFNNAVGINVSQSNTFYNVTSSYNDDGWQVSGSSFVYGGTAHGNGVAFTVSGSGATIAQVPATNNTIFIKIVPGTTNVTVSQNDAVANYIGMYLWDDNRTLFNNTFRDNVYGIFIYDSFNLTLLENLFTNNTVALQIQESRNISVEGNTFDLNPLNGVYINRSVMSNITGNSFTNSYDAIFLEGSHNNLIYNNNGSSLTGSGINMTGSDNNTIAGNRFNGIPTGILAAQSSGNLFQSNRLYSNTKAGINITSGNDNNVTGNTIYGNSAAGISLGGASSSGNRIFNNAIYGQDSAGAAGILLKGTSAINHIYDNVVLENNTCGISLASASFANITNNTVRLSTESGICLSSSPSNTLALNTARDNARHGFTLYLSDANNLSSNTAHDNHLYGYEFMRSSGTQLNSSRAYRNGLDLVMNNSGGTTIMFNMTGTAFLNPYGTFANFTNLTLHDSAGAGECYSVNWSSNSTSLPIRHFSFARKYVDITRRNGTASINRAAWHWQDSELTGYDESRFVVWKRNATLWSDTGASRDTVANTLSVANLNPASLYGVLQENGTLVGVSVYLPPSSALLNHSTVTFNYSATSEVDPAFNCSLYVNSQLNQSNATYQNNTNSSFLSALRDGYHTWFVRCNDSSSGNVSETRNLTVDTAPPSISLNSPAPGFATPYQNVTFNFTARDSISATMNCSLRLDGGIVANNASVLNNTPTVFQQTLDFGQHYWNVTCIDLANNTNTSETRGILIAGAANLTQPTIAPPSGYKNTTFNASTTYTNIQSGNVTFMWYVNNVNTYNQTIASVANGSSVTSNITPAFFNHSDYINCSVFAFDGINASAMQWSTNTVQVSNTPPQISSPLLAPDPATISDSINATTTYTDLDSDPANLTFVWFVNNVNVYNQTIAGVANGSTVAANLSATNYTSGDRINASLIATDGYNSTGPLWSQTVQVYSVCNISVQIDDVETSAFPNSGVPYSVRVNVTNPDGSPLSGADVRASEISGWSLFGPVIRGGYTLDGFSNATSNSSGESSFALSPTRYNIPDEYGYSLSVSVSSPLMCRKSLSITTYSMLTPTYRTSLVNPSYESQFKSSVQNMNALASTATNWINAQKQRLANATVNLSSGGATHNSTLKAGAPNLLNITTLNASGSAVVSEIRIRERDGFIIYSPLQPGKAQFVSNSSFPSNESLIIIPTGYNNQANLTLEAWQGGVRLATFSFPVDSTLSNPGAGESDMPTATYALISTSMQNIISVLSNIGKSISTV